MCLYVRQLNLAEGRKLQSILRSGRNRIKMRRAQVVLASAQGSKAPDIARRFYYSPQHVRTIVKDFNANGFKALEPKYGGGRPRTFTDDQRSLIVETAVVPAGPAGPAVPALVAGEAAGLPGGREDRRVDCPGDDPADPQGQQGPPATHEDVERVQRPEVAV